MDRSFDARACVRRPAGATRGWLIGTALACGLGLGGCVEDAAQAPPPPAAPPADNIARRPDVSPAGATVGIASVGGAPGSLDDKFQAMFTAAAKRGDVSVSDGGDPNYLVRGYLSAYPEGDNTTAVSYVLDIFDAKKQRTQRVGDEIVVRGQAPDSWSLVSDDVLAAVAAKSAADLAAVMTNTPEAIAANAAPGAAAAQVATNASSQPADGRTVVAATATPPAPAPAAAAPSPSNGDGVTAQR
ncbi:MAG: hypothetical protein ACLQL2_06000 [Methylovirgula sp.]